MHEMSPTSKVVVEKSIQKAASEETLIPIDAV
jgi:hypothetical protein